MKAQAAQPPAPKKEPSSSLTTLGLDEDKRLVSWPDEKGKTTKSQIMTKEDARTLIKNFVEDGGDSDEVQVFKLAWVKVEKKVTVEVEI